MPKKKHKIYTDIRGMSHEEWLNTRNFLGIGGSDTPTIFGANGFESSGMLFHKKCGLIPIRQEDTVDTYRGRIMEPIIRQEYWPYWNPDEPSVEEFERNMNVKRKLRTVRQFNFMTQDNRFPWLFANTDGRFPASHGRPKGILECKAPRYFALKKGGAARKVYYFIQAQHYMLVMGYEYAEIIIVSDGVPEVLAFYADPTAQEKILERTMDFWQRIEKVRELQAKGAEGEEVMHLVNELEPEATGDNSWKEFLDEQHRELLEKEEAAELEMEIAHGNDEDIQSCIDYYTHHDLMTEENKKKQAVSNKIKQRMNHLQVKRINLPGDKLSIRWEKKLIIPRINPTE